MEQLSASAQEAIQTDSNQASDIFLYRCRLIGRKSMVWDPNQAFVELPVSFALNRVSEQAHDVGKNEFDKF